MVYSPSGENRPPKVVQGPLIWSGPIIFMVVLYKKRNREFSKL